MAGKATVIPKVFKYFKNRQHNGQNPVTYGQKTGENGKKTYQMGKKTGG